MANLICELPQWQHYSIVLIVAVLEAFLGKTKHGSMIGFVVNIFVSMMKQLKRR